MTGAKAWLRLFLPLALVIGAVFALYARAESTRALEALVEREGTRLHMAGQRLSEALTDAATDLRVIAGTPALKSYVAGDADARPRIEQLLAAFVREDWAYDQLRVVDASGRERVRVSRTPEGARIAGDDELQDKRGRDYLVETLKLLPGQIFVTRMELNVEYGVIQVPHRPVLRMATRLDRGASLSDQVLVANLRAPVLLKGLYDARVHADSDLWVLDSEGYWLMHPDARMLWGAQLDPKRRLAQAMPQLAAQLSRGAGWYRVDEGLYVFRRIDPLGDTARDGFVDNPPVFDLVSFTRTAALPPALPIDLWLPLVVVVAIAALGSALLVTSRLRVARAEQQSRALLEENSRANELRSWIKEHLYQLSLKMHGARDPEGFGALVLADLAQPLRLAAACFYAMQEGRAQPIAGYGLPERFELREFAPGEGLVGESIRTRSEKRLRPPPPGYLDASAGLGDGAAADLRILPLWVHGRTVGVLELAFVQLLDAREEEFLRQVLPLLALNLDSLLERHPVAA